MVRNIIKLAILSLAIASINSCKYDTVEPVEEVVISDSIDCSSTPATFSNDVLPLLQNNCTTCHTDGGASGGINLDNYDNVSKNANIVLSAIKHEAGVLSMPQNSDKLSDDKIQIIECWIQNGKQND